MTGSGGFGKSSHAQWLSLDRPRSRPALHSFDHPTSHLLPSQLLSPLTIAIAFLCSEYTSPKWVPFRKLTPTSLSRPSPSSSLLVRLPTPPPVKTRATSPISPESIANYLIAGAFTFNFLAI